MFLQPMKSSCLVGMANSQSETFGRINRSSCSPMFFKIGVPKNFAIITGKHLCRRLQHRCFLVNIAKFLRTACFIEHLRWLILNWSWLHQSIENSYFIAVRHKLAQFVNFLPVFNVFLARQLQGRSHPGKF